VYVPPVTGTIYSKRTESPATVPAPSPVILKPPHGMFAVGEFCPFLLRQALMPCAKS